MRAQIHLARCVENIDLFMRLDRLQRRPGPAREMAIIDKQRRPALHIEPPGQRLDQCRRSGTGFDHRIRLRGAQIFGNGLGHRAGPGHKGERAPLQPDHALAPALGGHHQLANRERVEEFIGEQQKRAILRQRVDRIVKLRPGQSAALDLAQRFGALDKMHLGPQTLAGHGAQRILGQRPAARPQFDIDRIAGASRAHPDIRQPQTRHFAEHLADFGRGGEIAPTRFAWRPQRVAGGVIARVAFAHIARNRHRPVAFDQAAEDARKLGSASAHAACGLAPAAPPTGGLTSAYTMTTRPIPIIGRLSHCPRERPVSTTT